MNIENLLDETNRQLLTDLRQDFDISFIEKDIDHCQVYTINNTSEISYNPKLFNNASIAHELLHVKLKRFKYLNNHIYHACLNHQKLNKIFTKELCDHISNCFDHLKMYPEYLQLGYSPANFLRNALDEKCTIKTIKQLRMKFLWAFKANSIDLFIGNLISIYADHVDNAYEEHLNLFRKKDAKLFQITTNLWDSWVNFDITDIDPIYNSDLDLFVSFVSDMDDWVRYKAII